MKETIHSEADEPGELAAELFADALARLEGGEEVDLGALSREHPSLAPQLEALRERWTQLEAAMAGFEGPAPEGDAERASLDRLKVSGRRPERYRADGEIARGGMGAIFRVYDCDLERQSAKKVASLGSTLGSRARRARLARFLREARITGRLEHPGIVPVHDLGVDEGDRPYFTMPVVRGHDLRAVFAWVHEGREGWSLARVLGVLLKVCETVSYAHSRGVLHRDLKPANVMVGPYGEVLVMDWGLAKLTDAGERDPLTDSWSRLPRVEEDLEQDDDSPLDTREGDVLGTPSYMPPEQASGSIGVIDERADVYAIGAMMYHLLAGEAPYDDMPGSSTAHAVLAGVVSRPPTPLVQCAPEASPELVAICERAMAREREERYASAETLADDLRAWLEGRVVAAYEQGGFAQLRKWVGRNRALAALFAVLAIATPLAASLLTYVASTRDDVIAAEQHARAEALERALEEGFLELGEGDAAHALACFDEAREHAGGSLEAIAGRTFALMQLGRPGEVLDELDRAGIEGEPGLLMLRVDALRALGRGDEADALDARATIEPNTALSIWLTAKGEIARAHADEGGSYEHAVELFERAVRLSRGSRALYVYGLMNALAYADDDARALELAEVLELHWPEAPNSIYWAGFSHTGAGEIERGIEQLERALEMRPESQFMRYGLAWGLQRAGDLEASAQLYREYLSEIPDSFFANQNLAMVLRLLGEHEEAIEATRTALRVRPESAAAHWALGSCLHATGRLEDALPPLGEALRLGEENPNCRRLYAETLARVGRHQEAISELYGMIEDDPWDPESWSKLGVLQLLAGEGKPAARASLERALELDPLDPGARLELGILAYEDGDPARAGEHYEAALRGDPTIANAHLNLASIHQVFERFELAATSAERALKYEPGMPEAHCALGLALRGLGRYHEALDALRRGHERGTRLASWELPSQRWIEETEALVATEERLPAVLADPAQVPPAERAAFARHLVDSGRSAQALPLFESALADDVTLAESTRERWLFLAARAACAAAVASPESAVVLHELALDWLEWDLTELEFALADDALENDFVARCLDELRHESDLAGVREPDALERLSEEGASAWRSYWEAVDGLRSIIAEEEEQMR